MIGFHRILCVLAIFCMSWQIDILAQTEDLNDVHTLRYLEDATYKQLQDQAEAFIYRTKLNGMHGERLSGRGVLTIPVVVHIMHRVGDSLIDDATSNLSDERIRAGINSINELFRNTGSFAGDAQYTNANIPSVDTEIEFCLAQFDPQGNPTTGITRTPTALSDLYFDDFCTNGITKQDQCMKELAYWDVDQYLNIYIVNFICKSASEPNGPCNLTGYSYNVGARGQSIDGPVLSRMAFSGASEDAALVAHEIGHYLGLFDTYFDPPGPKPPCVNNNCLLDGDKVCDTPPDSDPQAASCLANQRVNSCSTDTADTSANNPFRTDVQDMYENYMDKSESGCKNTFTAGQKDRMRITLLGLRSSLLSSKGCDLSVTDAGILSIENPRALSCEANLIPSVKIVNKGTTIIGSMLFHVTTNNGQPVSYTWNGNLQIQESVSIDLNPVSPSLGRNTIQVELIGVNGNPDLDESDNVRVKNFINTNHPGLITEFPYCMDFEDPTMVEDWITGDLDAILTFDLAELSSCSNAGGNSLRYNTNGSWNNGDGPVASAQGTRDFFIGPQFDLTEYGLASLNFDVAFKELREDKALTLKVWAITDCGESLALMYDKSQDVLRTSQTPYDPFILGWEPEDCNDWRNETISLNDFIGQRVRIVFEVDLAADFSQNIYLDNICLQAEKVCEVPTKIPEAPGIYVASTTCIDDEGNMHFIKKAGAEPQTAEDLLLLTLKEPAKHGIELGPGQVRVVVTEAHGNQGHNLSEAIYAENMYGWHAAGRYFQIDEKRRPTSPVELTMYFSSTDFKDMNQVLSDTTKMRSEENLAVYTLAQLVNPDLGQQHRNISQGEFKDYRIGTEPSDKHWTLSKHGEFFGASIAVAELGSGGVGTGGEGRGYGATYPVPFKAVSFEQDLGSVVLNWSTLREKNMRAFGVYKAGADGVFEKIEEVLATGDTNEESTYSFRDIPNSSEPSTYLIKALHHDDLVIRSEPILVTLERTDFVKLFPNPTVGKMEIALAAQADDQIEFIVRNASWQKLYRRIWTYNGTNPVLNVSHLPRGVYFYDVLIREERYWGKLLVIPGK